MGDTTDIVQKEMYTFTDKGERSITLRPEGHRGRGPAFVEHKLFNEPLPAKMFYLSYPVFRYENPQSGRLRQHHQFGVEVYGAQDAACDAEVILLAATVLSRLGIGNLDAEGQLHRLPGVPGPVQPGPEELPGRAAEQPVQDLPGAFLSATPCASWTARSPPARPSWRACPPCSSTCATTARPTSDKLRACWRPRVSPRWSIPSSCGSGLLHPHGL